MSLRIRLFAELNDFVHERLRHAAIEAPAGPRRSVKDLIESFGVPHTEVGLITVNGESEGFGRVLAAGESVNVYPRFRSIDVSGFTRTGVDFTAARAFVLDQHLGKLASYLRMLGFDVLYRNDYTDPELARVSADEGRILLTRDRGLLKRSAVTRGYFVRENDPLSQLEGVIGAFGLRGSIRPLTRCLACNGQLAQVEKEAVAGRLMPKTAKFYEEFFSCAGCGRIYWKGSHYTNMKNFIDGFLEETQGGVSI